MLTKVRPTWIRPLCCPVECLGFGNFRPPHFFVCSIYDDEEGSLLLIPLLVAYNFRKVDSLTGRNCTSSASRMTTDLPLVGVE